MGGKGEDRKVWVRKEIKRGEGKKLLLGWLDKVREGGVREGKGVLKGDMYSISTFHITKDKETRVRRLRKRDCVGKRRMRRN